MGVRNLKVGDTVWFMRDNRPRCAKVNQRCTYELAGEPTKVSYTVDGNHLPRTHPVIGNTYHDIEKSEVFWTRGALLKSLARIR
jgi:hypothetical protein